MTVGSAVAAGIVVNELQSLAGLERIERDWYALWQRCSDATPFQSPQWLLPWMRHMYAGGDIFALTLRIEGRLVGLAPLFIHRYWRNFDIRQVSLIGAGISDYLDFLIDPATLPWAAEALLDHLIRHRERWDICDLQELRPNSPLLSAAAPDRIHCAQLPAGVCPVLSLPRSMDELKAGLASKFRRDLHRAGNHLRTAGHFRFETADAENLDEHLDALFRLHAARWRLRNEQGMLETENKRRFHTEVAHAMARAGHLRVHSLRLHGEIVAVVYAFQGHGRTYAYLGGFDPSLSKLSLGGLIMEYSIAQAIEEGSAEFDFLRKREEYKYLWGAVDRPNARLMLWHANSQLPSAEFPHDEPYEH
ncbi:MAG: GNAT family N-acetyltransferase [Bryobacterales bacterium]|nr:GNAT family N-acetyltransferase [Bryobacterales bacterium]